MRGPSAFLIVALGWLLGSGSASAQARLCGECSLELLELRTHFAIAFEYTEVRQAGETLEPDSYAKAFSVSPDATRHFEWYQTLTTIGRIQVVLGGLALITGIVIYALGSDGLRRGGALVSIGGGAVYLIGTTFVAWGRSNLLDAVNAHNRAVLDTH